MPTSAASQGLVRDIYASLAALVNKPLLENDAPDSMNVLDAYLGISQTGRTTMLEESFTLSIREGDWKYISPLDQNTNIPPWMIDKNIETGLSKNAQLYNLSTDIGEQKNVAESNQELVNKLDTKLSNIKQRTSIRAKK